MLGSVALFPAVDGSTTAAARGIARGVLDALFPWRCAGCGETADSALCLGCRARIRWIDGPRCPCCGIPFATGPSHPCGRCERRPPAFARLRACACYLAREEERDPLGTAIRALKYGRRRALAATLGAILADRFPFQPGEHDRVAPVPMHRARLRERGFNQAALLARAVARRAGAALDLALLCRPRPTEPQASLREVERRRNLRGALALRRGRRVEGLRILLVDDVCTSGATADACARVLRAAGAASIDVVTLAHTLLR